MISVKSYIRQYRSNQSRQLILENRKSLGIQPNLKELRIIIRAQRTKTTCQKSKKFHLWIRVKHISCDLLNGVPVATSVLRRFFYQKLVWMSFWDMICIQRWFSCIFWFKCTSLDILNNKIIRLGSKWAIQKSESGWS